MHQSINQFTIIYLKQTMIVGYTVQQPFCGCLIWFL